MKQLLLICAVCITFCQQVHSQGADSLLHFIKTHPEKSSVTLIRNDTLRVSLQGHKLMPLASTMKVVIAIEFAKQAAFNVFDTSKMVAVSELNKYFLPLTDGNAHMKWLQYEKKNNHVIQDSIALIHVARGMIMFSSNANTEYLMDLLGLQNINGNYRLMGIKEFTPLYYFVSALFLYQNPKKLKEEKVLKEVSSLSDEAYRKSCMMIHEQLKKNPTYKAQFNINDLTIPMQKEWSDRLPASTTHAYARIGQILNSRQIFSEKTYQILERVLETFLEGAPGDNPFARVGMKGGSTMFTLTKMLYVTLKNGNTLSLAYFFNDLDPADQRKLEQWMDAFELAVLRRPDFLDSLSSVQ